MIDPLNIKELSYRYDIKAMEITLKKPELMQGYNRDKMIMKCSFETFAKYVSKWMKIKQC